MTKHLISNIKLNMMMTKKIMIWIKRYRMHVLGWLGFIFYENLVLIGLNIAGPDFTHIIFHFIINIGFFYAFSEMILHWAWRADLGDWWRIPLGFILSLAVYIAF